MQELKRISCLRVPPPVRVQPHNISKLDIGLNRFPKVRSATLEISLTSNQLWRALSSHTGVTKPHIGLDCCPQVEEAFLGTAPGLPHLVLGSQQAPTHCVDRHPSHRYLLHRHLHGPLLTLPGSLAPRTQVALSTPVTDVIPTSLPIMLIPDPLESPRLSGITRCRLIMELTKHPLLESSRENGQPVVAPALRLLPVAIQQSANQLQGIPVLPEGLSERARGVVNAGRSLLSSCLLPADPRRQISFLSLSCHQVNHAGASNLWSAGWLGDSFFLDFSHGRSLTLPKVANPPQADF